jgi:6-pyruvoyl-tetrahydropterin synthase
MELAVSFGLECAHRAPVTGKLHGHSYAVTVWFTADERADIECLAAAVKKIGAMVDHTELEESVGGARMEDIANWLMPRMCLLVQIEPTRINVSRPSLGLQCELRRE